MPTWLAVLGFTVIALCVVGLVMVERSRRATSLARARFEADRRAEHARLTEGAPVRKIRPGNDS